MVERGSKQDGCEREQTEWLREGAGRMVERGSRQDVERGNKQDG
jgi:hypothetical protein